MHFKAKPKIIEAEQFSKSKPLPFRNDGVCCFDGVRWYIHTLEGQLFISEGDWIIKGVKGEVYPIKNDIFEMTYEKVE